jgi:hypothetical protein
MVKCGVLFEVRTKSLNIIRTSFGFKGLIRYERTRLTTGCQYAAPIMEPYTPPIKGKTISTVKAQYTRRKSWAADIQNGGRDRRLTREMVGVKGDCT